MGWTQLKCWNWRICCLIKKIRRNLLTNYYQNLLRNWRSPRSWRYARWNARKLWSLLILIRRCWRSRIRTYCWWCWLIAYFQQNKIKNNNKNIININTYLIWKTKFFFFLYNDTIYYYYNKLLNMNRNFYIF